MTIGHFGEWKRAPVTEDAHAHRALTCVDVLTSIKTQDGCRLGLSSATPHRQAERRLRLPRQRHCEDTTRSGGQARLSRGAQRTAGGGHVVHEEYRAPADLRAASERPAQIEPPLL